MILQIRSQQPPAVQRGGVHHVGDVVTLVLAGARVTEGQTRNQAIARTSNRVFGVTVAQATSVLA
ncbi:MAG: hypothetical protein K8T91_09500 [Planctomycetes bacterium]|nr:hypothetical protein [Planctomycetota bacterium]